MVRDRDVPGPRSGPGWVLLLAAQPPLHLTNSTSPLYRSPIGALPAMLCVLTGGYWYGTVIFLALALALAGFCGWWIRRRRLC